MLEHEWYECDRDRNMASKIMALFARENEGPTAVCWSHGRHGSRWNSGSGRVEVRSVACQISFASEIPWWKKTVFFVFNMFFLWETWMVNPSGAASAKTWIIMDYPWPVMTVMQVLAPPKECSKHKEPGGTHLHPVEPGGTQVASAPRSGDEAHFEGVTCRSKCSGDMLDTCTITSTTATDLYIDDYWILLMYIDIDIGWYWYILYI